MEAHEWKRLLEPYAEKYEQVILDTYDTLDNLSDDDLRKVLVASQCASETNCGWSTFQIARKIRSHAAWRLKQRAEAQP